MRGEYGVRMTDCKTEELVHLAPVPGKGAWIVQRGGRKTAYAGYSQLEVLIAEKKRSD